MGLLLYALLTVQAAHASRCIPDYDHVSVLGPAEAESPTNTHVFLGVATWGSRLPECPVLLDASGPVNTSCDRRLAGSFVEWELVPEHPLVLGREYHVAHNSEVLSSFTPESEPDHEAPAQPRIVRLFYKGTGSYPSATGWSGPIAYSGGSFIGVELENTTGAAFIEVEVLGVGGRVTTLLTTVTNIRIGSVLCSQNADLGPTLYRPHSIRARGVDLAGNRSPWSDVHHVVTGLVATQYLAPGRDTSTELMAGAAACALVAFVAATLMIRRQARPGALQPRRRRATIA